MPQKIPASDVVAALSFFAALSAGTLDSAFSVQPRVWGWLVLGEVGLVEALVWRAPGQWEYYSDIDPESDFMSEKTPECSGSLDEILALLYAAEIEHLVQ